MTLFPAGIEIFKDKRVGPLGDSFSQARGLLHEKLARISCPKAISALPRELLFEQVGIVVEELLEHEKFEFSNSEQTILSRVLAYDLMASQGRKAMVERIIH